MIPVGLNAAAQSMPAVQEALKSATIFESAKNAIANVARCFTSGVTGAVSAMQAAVSAHPIVTVVALAAIGYAAYTFYNGSCVFSQSKEPTEETPGTDNTAEAV